MNTYVESGTMLSNAFAGLARTADKAASATGWAGTYLSETFAGTNSFLRTSSAMNSASNAFSKVGSAAVPATILAFLANAGAKTAGYNINASHFSPALKENLSTAKGANALYETLDSTPLAATKMFGWDASDTFTKGLFGEYGTGVAPLVKACNENADLKPSIDLLRESVRATSRGMMSSKQEENWKRNVEELILKSMDQNRDANGKIDAFPPSVIHVLLTDKEIGDSFKSYDDPSKMPWAFINARIDKLRNSDAWQAEENWYQAKAAEEKWDMPKSLEEKQRQHEKPASLKTSLLGEPCTPGANQAFSLLKRENPALTQWVQPANPNMGLEM